MNYIPLNNESIASPCSSAELGGDPTGRGRLHPRHLAPRARRAQGQLRDHQDPLGPGRRPAHATRCQVRSEEGRKDEVLNCSSRRTRTGLGVTPCFSVKFNRDFLPIFPFL